MIIMLVFFFCWFLFAARVNTNDPITITMYASQFCKLSDVKSKTYLHGDLRYYNVAIKERIISEWSCTWLYGKVTSDCRKIKEERAGSWYQATTL